MVIILLYILYFLGFATGIDEPSTSTVTDARTTPPANANASRAPAPSTSTVADAKTTIMHMFDLALVNAWILLSSRLVCAFRSSVDCS